MKLSHIFLIIVAVFPHVALADMQSGDPNGQAQAPQNSVGASDLLPQSGTVGGNTSSTGAGTTLQPGASMLQGSTGDGSSLAAPSDQALQANSTTPELKVLLGAEADGSPKSLENNSNVLGEDIASIAGGVLIICIALAMLRRRVQTTDLFFKL